MLWGLALALAALAGLQTWSLVNFQPLGVDFLPPWTAGRLAWKDLGPVYDFTALTRAQQWLLGPLKWDRPFAYPPTALLLFAPFGLLPFWAGYIAWTCVSLGVFLGAALRLFEARRRLAASLAAVAPAVVLAILVGQTVLLVAGFAILAFVELRRRPRLAGVLLGIAAAIKPQALLLAPVALVTCGAYEAFWVAGCVLGILATASLAAFGADIWLRWFGALQPFQRVVDSVPHLRWGMITPDAAAQALGLTGFAAVAWRGLFGALALAMVWWVFSRPTNTARRLIAVLGGALLVTPYAMHYDASVLAPPAIFLAIDGLSKSGWIVRFAALIAALEITTPFIGWVILPAFLVLSLFDFSPPLEPALAKVGAGPPCAPMA
jgi:hypothetical protein